MIKKTRMFLMVWSLLFLVFAAVNVQAVTILPLGDSITQADCNHYSYRYNLWKKLIDAQMDFDLIGSMTGNAWCNPSWPTYQGLSFDPDNEGHYGWRTDEILNGKGGKDSKIGYLSKWLVNYTPDIVLLHLGTNDVLQANSIASTVGELEQVITLLQADNAYVTIYLAKLIPTTSSDGLGNAGIIALNNEIDGIAFRKQTANSQIIVVDQYQGFNPATDLYDPWHPNELGEEKMAQKWFDAMMGIAPSAFAVSPSDSLTFSGVVGGPFSPASGVYTLYNNSDGPLNWTVSHTETWLTTSPAGGTLAAHGWVNVSVYPTAAADSLPAGTYNDTLTFEDTTNSITEIRDVVLQCGGGTGTILREYWTNIAGTAVSALTSDPGFPNSPDGSGQLTSLEGPTNWADDYGTLISGYVHPSTTGTYTFWVAGDDNTDLYLSTNDQPANAVLIAQVPDWTNSREWTKFAQQQSSAISLVAGQKYYIEVLHKESGGGDNVAVAWQGPGISQQVIPGAFLSPWVGPHGGGTPQPDMYVFDIALSSGSYSGGRYSGIAAITIKDDTGALVSGATVNVNWSGASSGSMSGATNAGGQVVLESAKVKNGGTFTVTVTNVTKSGTSYNPALNVETTDSITAP